MRLYLQKMIGRGLFILTTLSSCVLSLPVTSSHLENEDVKVMKCIVEALTDVLSRPHSLPISQECLVILKTDDRLVTILRHHNFLKELQHIAVQGDQERAQDDIVVSDHVTHVPQTTDPVPDQSMLDALGGPGERSILNQKRKTANGDGGEEEDDRVKDEESQEHSERDGEEEEKREKESVSDWSEGKAERREEEEEEEEEKRVNSEENSEEGYEEENMTKEKKADESDEKGTAPEDKSEEKKFAKENEEEREDEGVQKKRSSLFSHDDTQAEREEEEEEEDEGEMRRGSREGLKRWSKRAKGLPTKKRAGEAEGQQLGSEQQVPHHSKEVVGEEEEKNRGSAQRSPEVKELQMIARRAPEERRGLEEEGSASRKPEEPEIESLAAIESELESVAQKLHELRRG